VPGAAYLIADLITELAGRLEAARKAANGQEPARADALLLLGAAPAVTSVLRDIAHVFGEQLGKRVLIVDPSKVMSDARRVRYSL
jgi:hypothetical protein